MSKERKGGEKSRKSGGGRLRGEREIEARFCDFWRRKKI
jgi:hypothetical protein